MTIKRTSLLDQLTAHWAANDWDPAVMASFRMMAGEGDGGGSGDDGAGDGKGGDDGAAGSGSEKGFPENTPIAEMTSEQQAAYWKHQSRRHEATAKSRGDYDDLKTKAAKLAEIEAANQSELEKAQTAAQQAAAERDAAVQRANDSAKRTAVYAAAATAGAVDPADVYALLPADAVTLTEAGEVTGVKEAVAALAETKPHLFVASTDGKPPGTGGQGRRNEKKASAMDAGRAEAAKRFGDKAGASK